MQYSVIHSPNFFFYNGVCFHFEIRPVETKNFSIDFSSRERERKKNFSTFKIHNRSTTTTATMMMTKSLKVTKLD